MTDSDVRETIWEGKIPACFTLSQDDLVHEDKVPPPIYILLPRISYLPLVTEKVIRQFSHFIAPVSSQSVPTKINPLVGGDSEPEIGIELDQDKQQSTISKTSGDYPVQQSLEFWFEYAHHPLKWHYPIGLLFDLYVGTSDLPWNITVHFNNYPTDVLLAAPIQRQVVESHFMSMIKEADALKHRSQVINQMQARDHRQLWLGLLHHRLDQFRMINDLLRKPGLITLPGPQQPVESAEPQNSSSETDDSPARPSAPPTTAAATTTTSPKEVRGFRHIPLRLYRISHELITPMPGYLQKLIPSYDEEGLPISLKTAVRMLLKSGSASCQSDSTPDINLSEDTSIETNYVFITHGIQLPSDTPIQWIAENMAYPDNFVHMVAWPRSHRQS